MKYKGTGIIIRVVRPWEAAECNPNSPPVGQLDTRDFYDSDVDRPKSISGVWTISDGADGMRHYTTSISPARLRQQFVHELVGSIGAVTGGSVGARVYACAYKVNPDAGSIEVLGTADKQFSASNGDHVAPVDISAVAKTPIVLTKDKSGSRFATISIETTTYPTCVGRVEVQGTPYLTHLATVGEGHRIEPNKDQIAKTSATCESTRTLAPGCVACVQTITADVPVSVDFTPGAPGIIDVVSKFESHDEKHPGESAAFAVHFVLQSASTCYDGECENKIARTRSLGREETTKQTTTGVFSPSIVHVTSVTSGGHKMNKDGTRVGKRESGGDGTVATMYDGMSGCVEVICEVENVDLSITGARVSGCENENCGVISTIVKSGTVDDQLARFSGARVSKTTAGGVEVCFVPGVGVGDRTIEIDWTIANKHVDKKKKAESAARRELPASPPKKKTDAQRREETVETTTATVVKEPPHEDGPHDDEDHHPPCGGSPICAGTVIIDAELLCSNGMVYDHRSMRCGHEGHSSGYAIAGLFFLTIVVGLLFLACIGAFLTSDSHKRHHNAD